MRNWSIDGEDIHVKVSGNQVTLKARFIRGMREDGANRFSLQSSDSSSKGENFSLNASGTFLKSRVLYV